MTFHQLDINQMSINPFQRIGNEWMLITAKKGETVHNMTASWGMMGVFWGENVVTVGIRPQRYTKEFVDAGDIFTLTFFDGERKKEMGYLGSVSGRDEDKIKKVDFHVTEIDGAPTFEEGKLVFVCKKLMETPLDPADFKESWIDEKWYEAHDYHIMYTAEVIGVYQSGQEV